MEQPEPLYIQPDDYMKQINRKKQLRKNIRLAVIPGLGSKIKFIYVNTAVR